MAKIMTKYSPNLWNDESVLTPCTPYVTRGSSKCSIVADIDILRYLRIDTHFAEDIITLGTDKWKVYPMYKRDTTTRIDFGSSYGPIQHSGTLAYALRYDGP
jgi:hypothetical protein